MCIYTLTHRVRWESCEGATFVGAGCLDDSGYGNHVSRDTRVDEVGGQLDLDGSWDSAGLPLPVPSQFLDPVMNTVDSMGSDLDYSII